MGGDETVVGVVRFIFVLWRADLRAIVAVSYELDFQNKFFSVSKVLENFLENIITDEWSYGPMRAKHKIVSHGSVPSEGSFHWLSISYQ